MLRFTTHLKPVLQQIRLLTGLNVGGKTRNIAIQLVLKQCCKTSCTFFVARFSVRLTYTCTKQKKQQAKRFLVYGSNSFGVIFK